MGTCILVNSDNGPIEQLTRLLWPKLRALKFAFAMLNFVLKQ